MVRVILSGCCGRMGHVISDLCSNDPDIEIVAGIDITSDPGTGYPVFTSPSEVNVSADVLLDFSNVSALDGILSFCLANKLPLIECTTGHSAEQRDIIENASRFIPILFSANMSMGITILMDLVKKACAALGNDFDLEIVERHHKNKLDAPSGTALMIANAAASALPYEAEYVYDRQSKIQKRNKNEIGISSVRGGSIVGEHEVIFAGLDEVIEIKHTAYSRAIFGNGAVKAAKFLASVSQPGLYTMADALNL